MVTKFLSRLATVLAFVAASPAMSAPLRIITIEGPPWGFVGSDNQPAGMMYEIGNKLAETAGLAYVNKLVPYARTAFDIEHGMADVILRFSNEHMERVATPVATIVKMPIIIVGPSGTTFRSLDDLRGKTVGVIRTSAYVAAFDANTAINKYAVNDYQIMANMIARHRLDAGIGSSAGLYYGAMAAGVKPEELGAPLVLGSNDFVLFYSKKTSSPTMIEALKQAAGKLAASGDIHRIVSKYTGQYGAALAPLARDR